MTRPDFVQWTLDTLASNWDTTNVDPQPVLIDQRDGERQDTSRRSVEFDLAENNAVTVGTQPTTTTEPIGTGYDVRIEAGVNVRVEAVHESETYPDQSGGVAGGPAFGALVAEVRRALFVDRVNPTANDNIRDLRIPDENDRSASEKDYFRVDLTVLFRGYEELP
jgi:hypothetical protein